MFENETCELVMLRGKAFKRSAGFDGHDG